jgi:hypothetical protein
LAGLYAGDLNKPIRRARDDYSDAVFRTTGGLSVPNISAIVGGIYNKYHYEMITAEKACYELGYDVPMGMGVSKLRELLPPLQQDQVGISPEDPIIGALKAGLAVQRYQWEQAYADAAFRAMQSELAQQK